MSNYPYAYNLTPSLISPVATKPDPANPAQLQHFTNNIFSVPKNVSTNLTAPFGQQLGNFASQLAVQTLGSYTGYPQVVTINTNKNEGGSYFSKYATLPEGQLSVGLGDPKSSWPEFQYTDFRAKIAYTNLLAKRFDGISALTRKAWIGGLYAAASASPYGAYSIFNLNGNKYFGAGIGDHSNPGSIINDFTMRSHVATRWDPTPSADGKIPGTWKSTRYPNELITPFRGDRVTVIDFGQRLEKNAYAWNPVLNLLPDALGAAGFGLTQDFIKFYFTGPKLHNGYDGEETDDIIVFRALINNLSDSFQSNWNPVQMIGRADPNYQYTGYSRDLNLDFTVIATSRDEVKPIWRKLNAMAGYTAPEYDNSTIALKAPWMRITIGDLFRQQPAILTSLSYTLNDSDTTWEINIEQDPTMKQVPHKISVSCQFTMITDYLPQKGGRFYTLADKFDKTGTAIRGNDNWLSDFIDNVDIIKQKKAKETKPGRADNTNQQEKKPGTADNTN